MPSQNSHAALDRDIAAYNAAKKNLYRDALGKWVVFHDCQLSGTYDEFDEAASHAVEKFGRGPYLIRRVGEEEWTMSASVIY